MPKKRTGTVLNPRGLPKGTPILQGSFYEGDPITAHDIGNWDHYVSAGFIEVSNG